MYDAGAICICYMHWVSDFGLNDLCCCCCCCCLFLLCSMFCVPWLSKCHCCIIIIPHAHIWCSSLLYSVMCEREWQCDWWVSVWWVLCMDKGWSVHGHKLQAKESKSSKNPYSLTPLSDRLVAYLSWHWQQTICPIHHSLPMAVMFVFCFACLACSEAIVAAILLSSTHLP